MADISKIKLPNGNEYNISVYHDHAIKSGQTIYNVTNYIYRSTALETIIYTGIKFVSGAHMPLVRIKGYAYGAGRTTELIIALYIYQNAFYSSRTVTNLGVWTPKVYLFTYEKNEVKYVAIGLSGSIYFNMFSVDVQDEMGHFQNIDRDGWDIVGYPAIGNIPDVGTDDCVSVNYGIDILNPPKVNSHTVEADVPANAKFTDTTYPDASTSVKGITKLNSATNSTSTTEAATPSAVKTAYDLANTANGTANTALSGVNGTLIYDHTYSISNGVATFTPHVYLKGQEVTTNYAVSCFGWKYRLIDGSEVNLTTNTNRGCTVTITNLGYGGHVIGTFTPPS